jgi:hypothetical protein
MGNRLKGSALVFVGAFVVYVVVAVAGAKRAVDAPHAVREPVSEAQAGPISGSRLKGKYKLGDDGSKAYDPLVFHDAQRNEDCAYAIAADGVTRCLPTAVTTEPIFYKDAACTQGVVGLVTAGPGCPFTPPPYATRVSVPLCGSPDTTSVFPTGALTTVPSPLYYVGAGTCQAGPQPSPSLAYYTVGAELSASLFVDGTPGVDP